MTHIEQTECFTSWSLQDELAFILGIISEMANTVGVTDNTVRSQIKSIFSKTGVRRQSDLVRLLLCQVQPLWCKS